MVQKEVFFSQMVTAHAGKFQLFTVDPVMCVAKRHDPITQDRPLKRPD